MIFWLLIMLVVGVVEWLEFVRMIDVVGVV